MSGAGDRVINFSAGPSAVPVDVLKIAQDEMLNYNNSGCSAMELSHRSKSFDGIIKTAEKDLREILSIPSNYKVIFMQGGGTGQFSAIPLNLCPKLKEQKADYVITGTWSKKAAEEASKYVQVNEVLPKTKKFEAIPPKSEWKTSSDASYLYYCDNETIHGVEFPEVPTASCPVVCDMSSNIMTRPIDISKFGLIFAGAQKNLGPSGVTIVIVREDLIAAGPHPMCPAVMDYKTNAANDSLYNTPPTYAIYILGLVLKWVKSNGGIEGMRSMSAKKSGALYNLFESSNGFYINTIDKSVRSRVNIPFRIKNDEELEKKFLGEAEKAGMIQLKGHRSVGGIRASVFNAISVQDTMKLVDFLKEFQKKNS